MSIESGVGEKELHFGIVTRNIDTVMGTKLRGAVFFKSDTLTNGTEYPEAAQPSFPLAGQNGEGFFWVPQIGDQIEIEIDKADEHPVPRYTRMLYSSEDEVAAEFTENYPLRMGWKTRTGHLFLFDNNMNSLLIRLLHSTGTGFDWDVDGNEIKNIVGNFVETINGEIQRTVELKVNEIFKAEVFREITGKLTETFRDDVVQQIQGQLKQSVKADSSETVDGTKAIVVKGDCEIITKGNVKVEAGGHVEVMGSQIHLNGSGGSVVTTGTDPLVDNITGAPHLGVPTVLAG